MGVCMYDMELFKNITNTMSVCYHCLKFPFASPTILLATVTERGSLDDMGYCPTNTLDFYLFSPHRIISKCRPQDWFSSQNAEQDVLNQCLSTN